MCVERELRFFSVFGWRAWLLFVRSRSWSCRGGPAWVGQQRPWGDRNDAELAYWGLVHQPSFAADLERLRERGRREAPEAWTLDPLEVVKRRYPDATRLRMGTKQSGVCIVYFQRGTYNAHVVLYQPLREWEGDKCPWEITSLRGQKDTAYECLEEPPL